jgi:hypothetical protein
MIAPFFKHPGCVAVGAGVQHRQNHTQAVRVCGSADSLSRQEYNSRNSISKPKMPNKCEGLHSLVGQLLSVSKIMMLLQKALP